MSDYEEWNKAYANFNISEFLLYLEYCTYRDILLREGNYIVVERGIPTKEMYKNQKVTRAKLLTVNGTQLIPDNLPGLVVEEGKQ
jgi:hypothetical protein